jgi:hypothetical protein
MKLSSLFSQLTFVAILAFPANALATEPVDNLDRANFVRERIEWCDVWIPDANVFELRRVLLVGDSITRAYYSTVEKQLKGKAYCARFATSACVSDPAFLAQLKAVSTGYTYDIIHFNNGLHGFDYTEEEYQAGYAKVAKFLRNLHPNAKLIFALSTPLQSTSDKNSLNPRIDVRNNFVRQLASEQNAVVNDLHALSKDHPEYYTDPYHYKPVAIQLQGKQVAESVLKLIDE